MEGAGTYEKRENGKIFRSYDFEPEKPTCCLGILIREFFFGLRDRGPRVTDAVAGGAQEEGDYVDGDAVGGEEGSEAEGICEGEPGVW